MYTSWSIFISAFGDFKANKSSFISLFCCHGNKARAARECGMWGSIYVSFFWEPPTDMVRVMAKAIHQNMTSNNQKFIWSETLWFNLIIRLSCSLNCTFTPQHISPCAPFSPACDMLTPLKCNFFCVEVKHFGWAWWKLFYIVAYLESISVRWQTSLSCATNNGFIRYATQRFSVNCAARVKKKKLY